jgi:hypothetical protein
VRLRCLLRGKELLLWVVSRDPRITRRGYGSPSGHEKSLSWTEIGCGRANTYRLGLKSVSRARTACDKTRRCTNKVSTSRVLVID